MSNTNRGPFYTHEQLTEVADFGAGELEYVLSRTQLVRDYEAARAKDAELIQMLVDDLRILRIEFGNRVGQTTEIGIASLSTAEASGFKPSDSTN